MNKILGYGFKLSQESLKESLTFYTLGNGNDYQCSLCPTKELAKNEIDKAKAHGHIPVNAKPRIFKVVVEVE